ncbi:mannan-binding lectin [Plakobranchus ocellatus]|uniref:Mannan-binding lectin n=1 Tax=Plakobranchus ocellatus TaxID=259542 RepID=A0AAV3ZJS5_9GAST|nr:mannan-binding lectin [Plakobranchus ocellatus]
MIPSLLLVLISVQLTNCQRKEMWYQRNGRCYYIPNSIGVYEQQRTVCQKLGAHPVEMNDQAEFDVMQQFLDETNQDQFWVGTNYLSNMNAFQWALTGKDVPKSMWFINEPNLSGQCVRLLCAATFAAITGTDIPGTGCHLADHACTLNYNIICEKAAEPAQNQIYSTKKSTILSIPEPVWCQQTTRSSRSLSECAARCTQTVSCGAFIYNSSHPDHTCGLYSAETSCSDPSLEEAYNHSYYIKLPQWHC